ncbi:c-type cytochrome [Polynucleobacter necessarius]|uniref:c-type cytochrome n=1 Tax=Polynucleobacter necessarius TaxID=576610 RepID=UPI0018D57671|nr:c-type cytochrome [Polynucleobacter necessarius]
MKTFLFLCLLAASIKVATANNENQKAYAIAKQNACLGCHAIDKKIVGPSFQAVAQNYKGDSSAQAFIQNKIINGGSGSWGVVPMPANTKLSAPDVSLLSAWILRGAPQ